MSEQAANNPTTPLRGRFDGRPEPIAAPLTYTKRVDKRTLVAEWKPGDEWTDYCDFPEDTSIDHARQQLDRIRERAALSNQARRQEHPASRRLLLIEDYRLVEVHEVHTITREVLT